MSELLPCPFCGGEAKLIYKDSTIICLANCGSLMCDHEVSNSLISAWNTRADGWQPIETAPKDGTDILVNASDSLSGGLLSQINPNIAYPAYWSEMRVIQNNVGSWMHDSVWRSSIDRYLHYPFPTKWMPLPTPPEEGA